MSEPASAVAAGAVYGPIDTERPERRDRDEVRQPAPECPQSSEDVIVVCAPVDTGDYRLRDLPRPGETGWNAMDAATTVRLGPVEIQPQVLDGDSGSPIPAKGVGVGMRVRF